jgi:hypothetical protein
MITTSIDYYYASYIAFECAGYACAMSKDAKDRSASVHFDSYRLIV